MPLRYALLTAVLFSAAAAGAQGPAVASAEDPGVLMAALVDLRGRTSESKAFSMSDTRRYTLAQRLLQADARNALAHEELALRYLLEFDWRRQMARRFGRWDSTSTRGMSGGANRARRRALEHVTAALAAEPARAGAHRIALRVALLAEDSLALAHAAAAYHASRPDDPDAALAAALAAWRAGDAPTAAAFLDSARTAISPADRRALDDPAPFMAEDEGVTLDGDSAAAAARAWGVRDPLRLTPENERHLEHAARLVVADLLFGNGMGGRGWETARGQVYLRFGPPDYDAEWTAANHIAKVFGAMNRWVYSDPDGFTLTFEDGFRSGDFDFASSSTGEDDVTRARGLFRTVRERYALRPAGGLIPLTTLTSRFRGANGATDLVVSFGLPVPDRDVPGGTPFGLDAGAFLLGTDGEVAAEARLHAATVGSGDVIRVDTTTLWTGALALSVPPGAYTLDVEALQPASRRAGAVRGVVEAPAFAGDGLQLSDLLLATAIDEDGADSGPGVVRRGGFAIRPAAAETFATGDPLYVYVEIYGLRVEDGRARYEVEAALRPADRAGALRRLSRRVLGRRAPAGVAVRAGGERAAAGTHADDVQYVVLDAADQPPGAYSLSLTIRDLATGDVVTATRPVTLY